MRFTILNFRRDIKTLFLLMATPQTSDLFLCERKIFVGAEAGPKSVRPDPYDKLAEEEPLKT